VDNLNQRNKIILVSGYCATGKSTFSQKVSEHLKIPYFNKDVIKEVLGDGFGSDNDIVYQKGSVTTFLILLHIVEKLLDIGDICILESNFKLIEIEQIKELLHKYDCECLTFIFKGDFKILFKRYHERDKSGKRHWVHRTAGETEEHFKKGHINTGIGEIGIGKTIITDTTSFKALNYEELIVIARNFIG
jgi:predicted kinase